MRNSSKDFSVFDFEADGGIHHLKQPDVSDLSCIDLHEVDSPERSTVERNVLFSGKVSKFDEVKACLTGYDNHSKKCTSDLRSGSLVQEDNLVMKASRILVSSVYDDEESELQFSEIPPNMMSEDEETWTSGSGASFTSGDLPESEGHPECSDLENCHSASEEMDDNKKAVIVYPDYVTYRGTLFLECQLTFCSGYISIECSDAGGSDEKFIRECDIADIIRIGCQWSRSVEALLIKFWMRTNAGKDIENFLASVTDMYWLEKEQNIKSLAERYECIWDTLHDNNYAIEDDIFRSHMSFSKRYFTEMLEPFEDVIYPKGDPDAVSISKRDIELLEPDTFINDTIIDFYIKYLQDKVQATEKKRFHFFNSFFFRKLADLDKDPGSISEGKAAFQRVRKWTRKLNIFEKDYIFIPVNFNLHWSLLVICHPGEITTFKDDDIKTSSKVPCILHMDSIKGSHIGLKNLIQSYLLEEWKGRRPECLDDISRKFSSLRFVSLELPQQENSSDCGLFLLHYVELFLEEAPVFFNPTKITKLSNFLTADWFPPAEASYKRFHIRGLICELLRDSSQKLTPTCSTGDFPGPGDDVDQPVDLLSAQGSPSKKVNGSASEPLATQDDPFEQKATSESSHMFCPIEERGDAKAEAPEQMDRDAKADTAEQLDSVNIDQDGFQPPAGCETFQICSISKSVNDEGSSQMMCISVVKEGVVDTLPITSNTNLAISNEQDESKNVASPVVDGCAFVPDTPNTCDEKLEEHAKDSQELDRNEMEVEKHEDSLVICGAAEDHCGDEEECLETLVTDIKRSHEEDCEKADTLEIEKGETEHYHESNRTTNGGIKADDSYMVENVDEEDCREANNAPEQDGGEGEDSREINVNENMSKNKCGASTEGICQDSATADVVSLDDDVTLLKREVSGLERQVSKRRKVVHHEIRRRVTRSSSKELAS